MKDENRYIYNFNFSLEKNELKLIIYINFSRLTSPNYPNNYESDSLCVYEIQPLNSTFCGFTLIFRHLDLELSVDQLGRCNKDYLELPNNERICGQSKPLESIYKS